MIGTRLLIVVFSLTSTACTSASISSPLRPSLHPQLSPFAHQQVPPQWQGRATKKATLINVSVPADPATWQNPRKFKNEASFIRAIAKRYSLDCHEKDMLRCLAKNSRSAGSLAPKRGDILFFEKREDTPKVGVVTHIKKNGGLVFLAFNRGELRRLHVHSGRPDERRSRSGMTNSFLRPIKYGKKRFGPYLAGQLLKSRQRLYAQ